MSSKGRKGEGGEKEVRGHALEFEDPQKEVVRNVRDSKRAKGRDGREQETKEEK